MKESGTLYQARAFEKQNMTEEVEATRPVFHLSAPIGWINDPNGFSLYQGEYHLFYQYHPYGMEWGPMHWGHSKTKDFIKWQQLPAALAPDREYDGQGCFSGSALETDGKHVLMYTGVLEKQEADGEITVRQTQCIAIGDGINYEKLEQNPVITSEQLPKGSSPVDFRDPRIWQENGIFYSIIGSRSGDGSGQLAVFSSKDLKAWSFEKILEKCNHEYGLMWECPDFFTLDTKGVILVSPQDMEADQMEFHGGNGTLCLIGSYDSKNVVPASHPGACRLLSKYNSAERENKRETLQNRGNIRKKPGYDRRLHHWAT